MKSCGDEIWLPICGYEDSYEVSNLGQVRSLDREILNKGKIDKIKGKILSACKAGEGYLFVGLSKNNKRKLVYVHRLVAAAFLPPSDGPHVNHLDFDKTNNLATNLEWVTPKQNTDHAIAAGKFRIAHMNGMTLAINNPARAKKLTIEQVKEIRAACAAGEKQRDIGKRFGIAQGVVSKIKRWAIWSDTPRIACISSGN